MWNLSANSTLDFDFSTPSPTTECMVIIATLIISAADPCNNSNTLILMFVKKR
ncbi:hypothetical protein Hanom_Chr13g01210561 [Helianthus anomalus]